MTSPALGHAPARSPGGRVVLLGLVVALATVACSPATPSDDPSPTSVPSARPTPTATATDVATGGSLRWGLSGDPTSLDPAFADDEDAQVVVDALFDSLTRLDEGLRPVPSVARTWSVSPDLRTWTFELDPEARFHDGRPVVAADFVRAFNRLVDGTRQPRSFLGGQLEDVVGWPQASADGEPLTGVRAEGDHVLVVELRRPNADLPSVLSHPTLGPVPEDVDDDPFAYSDLPIGNGPFRMAEPWAHDQFIRLTAVDDRAELGEVLFRIYADDPGGAVQWGDFVADQLHVARVPADQRRDAIATYGVAAEGDADAVGLLEGPLATTYHYGFQTQLPPFDDPVVRRAVSLAIDREALAVDVMRSTRRPADRLLPPGMLGSRPASCRWCRHDPDAARALLEEAGVVVDPAQVGPIRLLHNRGEVHARIAAHVADAVRELLEVEVEVVELGIGALAVALQAGDGHLHRAGWTVDHPMPGAFLTPLFHSRNVGRDNHSFFADAEVDGLLDAAAATAGLRERIALYQQAEDRIVDLAPVLPLLTYPLGRIVDDEVRGLRMDPLGRVDLTRVRLAR